MNVYRIRVRERDMKRESKETRKKLHVLFRAWTRRLRESLGSQQMMRVERRARQQEAA